MTNDLPDGITNPESQRDNTGEALQPGRVYLVWPAKGQPKRMIVADDPTTFDLIAQPCDERGKPIPDSYPQRVDQMAAGLVWEPTSLNWEGVGQ